MIIRPEVDFEKPLELAVQETLKPWKNLEV